MSGLDARFGELRSLLAQRPSPRIWEALMAILEAICDADEGQAQVTERLPYLEGALTRWPDALRIATTRQLDALERGEEPTVEWALVRTLKLSGHARLQHQTRAILAHPATQALPTLLLTTTPQPDEVWIEHVAPRVALRQLQLGYHAIQRAQLGALLEAARWERLESLDLGWTQAALVDAGPAMATSAALATVRTLVLAWSRLTEADVEALVTARLPALRALDLQYCRLDDTRAARLLSAMPLGGLERLDLGHNALGELSAQALATLEAPALGDLCVAGAELGAAQLMTILTGAARSGLRRLDARGCVLTSQERVTLRAHASGVTTLL